MDEELKRIVEAILFAAARRLELEEIAKLCKRPQEQVREVLEEWKAKLDAANSPTMLVQDGSAWRLTVREKYIPVIKRVVTKTELPKSILETLAVVAYKAPVLQSKVVGIRTNKAYDHLNFLENSGFITREKSGRTKLIRLAPKFFEYFDVDPDRLKKKWRNPEDVEKAIEAKEQEIEQSQRSQQEQAREQLSAPQINLEANGKTIQLETYDAVIPTTLGPTGVVVYKDEVGGVEVYGSEQEGESAKAQPAQKKARQQKPELVSKSFEKEPQEEVREAVAALHGEQRAGEPELQKAGSGKEPEEVAREAVEERKRQPEESQEGDAEREGDVAEEPEDVELETEKRESRAEEAPVQEQAKKAKQKTKSQETAQSKGAQEKKNGLFPGGVPKEMESRIDERVKSILGQTDEGQDEEK